MEKTLDQILTEALSIAKTGSVGEHQTKTASVYPESPRGAELRELAKGLRSFDIRELKMDGVRRVLAGEVPSRRELLTTKSASSADYVFERGNTVPEGLRNVSEVLRDTSKQLKEASLVSGFNLVRGQAAFVNLQKFVR